MKRIVLLVVVVLLGFYAAWPAWSAYQIHQSLERKDEAALAGKIDFDSVRKSLEPMVQKDVGMAMDRYIADLGPLGALLGGQIKQQYLKPVVDTALDTLITPRNIIRLYAEKDDLKTAAEKILVEEMRKPGSVPSGTGGSGSAPAAAPPGGIGGVLGKSLPGGLGEAAGRALQGAGGQGGQMPSQGDIIKGIAGKMRSAPQVARPEGAAKKDAGDRKIGLSNIKGFRFMGPLAMEVGVAKDGAATKPDIVAAMAFRGFDWKLVRIVPGE